MPDDAHNTESSASHAEIEAISVAFGASPTDTALRVQTFSFEDFAALLSRPTVGEKAGSYYIRGGDLSYPERANANLLSADLLIIDGDSSFDPETGEITSGAPPMDDVCDVLSRMGLAFVSHTTHSYIPSVLWKYRIAMPARMRSEVELSACVDCLMDRLHCEGVGINDVKENKTWAQPWFLPRVPDEDGVSSFQFRSNLHGKPLDVEHCLDWAAEQKARRIREEEARQKDPDSHGQRARFGFDLDSPIERFNREHGLDWVVSELQANGYRLVRRQANRCRFIRPGSESGTAGVVTLQGKRGDWCVYSHHGAADPLSGKLTDPFGLFTLFRHGGDLQAALQAIGVHTEERSGATGSTYGSRGGATGDWPEPIPLVKPLAPAEPYPLQALGAVLCNAAMAIVDITQCPPGIAANSVLAVASLATQPHADVEHPATRKPIPLSLFLITIAESGERKSAADHEALVAVKEREASLAETYRHDYSGYRNAHEAWEASRSRIKRNNKVDWRSVQKALEELGDEPVPPLKPHIVVSEPTFEGLAKLYAEGHPSLGLFSAEGGGFLGGHAMRDEGRLRALTGLSELWDGSPLKRTRAGDGSIHLPGRRLALNLMVQPGIAPLLLGDKLANGQGFLSRLLVSFPASTQGQRLQREPNPSSRPALQDYCDVIRHLLATRPRLIGNNELDPPKLRLTPAAVAEWRAYADKVERGLAGDRLPGGVRGLHNKAAELVLRVAGVLTLADEPMAQEISPEVLRRAIILTTYYLSEAARLYEAASVTEETGNAVKLLQWLTYRPGDDISVRDIVTFGPASLRETSTVEQSLNMLVKYGWCRLETVKTGGRDTKIVRLSRHARNAI